MRKRGEVEWTSERRKSIKLIFDRSYKMQPGTLCIVERLES